MVSTRRSGSGAEEDKAAVGCLDGRAKGRSKRSVAEGSSRDPTKADHGQPSQDVKAPRPTKRQKGKQKVEGAGEASVELAEASRQGHVADSGEGDCEIEGQHKSEAGANPKPAASQPAAEGLPAIGDVIAGASIGAEATDLLAPLEKMKNHLAMLLKIQKPGSTSAEAAHGWGNLISQYAQHPHVPLSGFCFTIGRSRGCNLQLKDPSISGILCRLWYSPSNGHVVVLENLGSNGVLQVNGKTLKKTSKIVLKGGDELLVTCGRGYSFIFQQLHSSALAGPANGGSSSPVVAELSPAVYHTATADAAVTSAADKTRTTADMAAAAKRAAAMDVQDGSSPRAASFSVFAPTSSSSMQVASAMAVAEAEAAAAAAAEAARSAEAEGRAEQDGEGDGGSRFVTAAAELVLNPRASKRGALNPGSATSGASDPGPMRSRSQAARAIAEKVCADQNTGGATGDARTENKWDGNETAEQDPASGADPLTTSRHMARTADGVGVPAAVDGAGDGNPEPGLGLGLGLGLASEDDTDAAVAAQVALQAARTAKEDNGCANSTEAAITGEGGEGAGRTGEDGQDVGREKETDEAGPVGTSYLARKLKEEIQKMVYGSESLKGGFDTFPYYLSESTKSVLVAACYIHLRRQEYAKFMAELPSMSPRILLSGPLGTELLQTALVKALASHFQAGILVFDGRSASMQVQEISATVGKVAGDGPAQEAGGEDAEEPGWGAGGESRLLQGPPPRSRFAKELAKELAGEGATAGSAAGASTSCCPPTSPFGNATAGLGTSPNTGSKKTLKKGDRVKYAGPTSTAGLGSGSLVPSLHSYLCSLHGVDSAKKMEPLTVRGPYVGCKGKVVMVFEENPRKVGVRFDRPIPGGNNLGNLCPEGHGFFCNVADLRLDTSAGEDYEKLLIDALFEVLTAEMSKGPMILFIQDVDKSILATGERYAQFKKRIAKLEGPVVVIAGHYANDTRKEKVMANGLLFPKFGGAHTGLLDLTFLENYPRMEERSKETPKSSKMLLKLFTNRVTITPPQDPEVLAEWKRMLERDMEALKADANRQLLSLVLSRNRLDCEGLDSLSIQDPTLTIEAAEKVVGWAASHHLMESLDPALRGEKLVLSSKSLEQGLKMLQALQAEQGTGGLTKSLKDVVPDNEFEKRLLSEVIPPNEIGVSFDDIGALEKVKSTLQELVMLPLQRPELFCKGQLTKPCKGILLFGPPGTGKTMLAKAVATQAGANFINISMATIASKWFGEGEKYVKAVFTLASKIAPSVVFIDEVDSMLGRREKPGEHEAMRKMKNELMANWDGLRTRDRERVLVLGATNRPFDLDDAVVRRFPRRLMVSLPDAENRAKILKVILAKEDLTPGLEISEIAALTEGFSGSDLKNLCVTAAYRPIREILKRERKEREAARAEGREEPPLAGADGKAPAIRSLCMEDFKCALDQVGASVASDSGTLQELTQWNDLYGEGGSRKKTTLSYFM